MGNADSVPQDGVLPPMEPVEDTPSLWTSSDPRYRLAYVVQYADTENTSAADPYSDELVNRYFTSAKDIHRFIMSRVALTTNMRKPLQLVANVSDPNQKNVTYYDNWSTMLGGFETNEDLQTLSKSVYNRLLDMEDDLNGRLHIRMVHKSHIQYLKYTRVVPPPIPAGEEPRGLVNLLIVMRPMK